MPVQGNANDIVRAVVRLAHPALSAIENVYHFKLDGTGTAATTDILTAVATVLDDIHVFLEPLWHEDTTLEAILVNLAVWAVDHWLNVGNCGDAATIATITPTGTLDPLPDAVCGLTQHITDVPRRKGAKYYGPFTEGMIGADGKFSATALGALLNAGLGFVAGYETVPNSALELEPVVLSPTAEIWTVPTAVVARSEAAYQRRRKSLIGL